MTVEIPFREIETVRGNYVRFLGALLCAACVAATTGGFAQAQGIYFPGVGAVNQSMGGASTAAPTDALGAMLWNPAAISGLPESEVDISSGFLIPNINVSSMTPFGGSGTTHSDSGLGAIANTALVFRFCEMPRLTIGMASYYAGGGGVNFPGDPTNPIFAPKFPATPPFPPFVGVVLGPSFANLIMLQTATAFSVQVTDRLSIGAAPIVDTVLGSFDPAFFGGLNSYPLIPTLTTFPSATGSRPYWGGGFKVGAFYHLLPKVDLGFGYTSPQWIENMVFNSRDPSGNPLTLVLPMTLPAIYSAGIGVKPTERLTVAVDCRFIDNLNSTPFGQTPAAGGLGWNDVFATAVGIQYQFSPKFSGRIGYSYNTPTFPGTATLFNVQAPAVTQNVVSCGLTARIADNMYTSLAYSYSVRNTVSGSALQTPGTSTSITADIHSIFLTMTVKFGTPSRNSDSTPSGTESSATDAGPMPITLPTPAAANPNNTPMQ
jgi:long-chain fatty acid transport protein